MSTLPSSPSQLPSWKQEVNRRLADHKNRKGFSAADNEIFEDNHAAIGGRAAAAAARVAARYAKAPSYSEMQASEARAALRAAEAATRAALEAQAAAQAVLDHLRDGAGDVFATESPSGQASSQWEPWEATPEQPAEFIHHEPLQVRWDLDMPARTPQQEMRAGTSRSWHEANRQFDPDSLAQDEAVEAQPIPANLIEFPREIVAPRRMRPRITEVCPETAEPQQLSIFEVDPNSVSTQPMAGAANTVAEPTWIGSSWQEIELDEQPHVLPDYYAIVPDDAPKLYQAPFGRRMMAAMVDTALILGVVCGIAALLATEIDHLPGMRVAQICGAITVLGFAALYEWFFLTFTKVTPGMRYAQLSLCTFDEQVPTREQVKGRLRAMLISVLPMGLGMLWSIFDDDQMSWHDRLSKTYLRLS